MRGATSPRLLLELMCAQVLLPAATTDEKSLLARLERLESGGRGTAAPVPQSPPRAPHSGTNDSSERTRVPQAPDRKPAKPAESTAPAKTSAGPAQAPAEPAEPALVPPAAPAAAGTSPADSLRQNWGAVLDAVKRERRVAWILLSNASVLSLEDGVLTLRFARDGDLKGFTTSGCDADLKRVLSAGFGLNVTVRGVTAADPGADPAGPEPVKPGPVKPGPGPAALDGGRDPGTGVPARDLEPRPRHEEPPADEIMTDDPPSGEPDGAPASVVTELTGMDLIQRELGGRVIGEIED
jgi:DNA polymerase-3 subunit gamma/tau